MISTKPGLNRYLRTTPGGLLRIDASRAKTEENLDGKYLLRTCDPAMTSEDIALGYKRLLEVERGWRDMKQVIDLRPVYHRKEERIRAHVLLCWLALLLVRIAENQRCHLAEPAPRARPHRAGHLHRARRDLPPAHRDQRCPAGHPRQARHRPAAEDLPAHPSGPPDQRKHPASIHAIQLVQGTFPHVKRHIHRLARFATAEPRCELTFRAATVMPDDLIEVFSARVNPAFQS